MKILVSLLSFLLIIQMTAAQTTTIVILNEHEQNKLRKGVASSENAKWLADSILFLAERALGRNPRPLEVVYYEGLLDINPNRIDTEKSFKDIDATVNLIYASYLTDNSAYGKKAVEFTNAWVGKYKATGNPINENKFVAFYWAYHLFGQYFSNSEKRAAEKWMRSIVRAEMARKHTPNNNWEAKRMKMIGLIACILNDVVMKDFALKGWRKYLGTAYYADGTSRDLKQRDALHYHLSGIKPALSIFVNLQNFDKRFDLYDYVGQEGGSIKKSIEYAVPYATGKKTREEWVNTTVKLDKERAAAGLTKYQPGKLFNPSKALPTFEWAVYYNEDWFSILGDKKDYATSWVGLLNSPIVRK
ncbi:MAG: alginate lyase family protein [Cyclobacteriaceae bacterium]